MRTAAVTGASSGVGAASAVTLAVPARDQTGPIEILPRAPEG
jgi:NAD(P)-dependent dehydrogenase (short-subunit alcohol dehydrogenase family)